MFYLKSNRSSFPRYLIHRRIIVFIVTRFISRPHFQNLFREVYSPVGCTRFSVFRNGDGSINNEDNSHERSYTWILTLYFRVDTLTNSAYGRISSFVSFGSFDRNVVTRLKKLDHSRRNLPSVLHTDDGANDFDGENAFLDLYLYSRTN